MAVCARVVTLADGTSVLALDPAAADLTTCQYVVQSGAEIGNSFLSMSAQDGAVFSGGVIACWLAAYGVRSVVSIIQSSGSSQNA